MAAVIPPGVDSMETWCFLKSNPAAPPENMAWDEALLEAVGRIGTPVVRFYSWSQPAATFGYFQKYAEVAQWTSLRPLIRRPTAGGLVPHDSDWTYSVVFPPTHSWFRLQALESYRTLHQWIRSAFARLNAVTELAPKRDKLQAGHCFAGPDQFDLLWMGEKLAGAAQRRNRLGLLIQGSVQRQPQFVRREEWELAMRQLPLLGREIAWVPLKLDEELLERVQALTREKYSQPGYNCRR